MDERDPPDPDRNDGERPRPDAPPPPRGEHDRIPEPADPGEGLAAEEQGDAMLAKQVATGVAVGAGSLLGAMALSRLRRSARRILPRGRLLRRFGAGALIVVLSFATCSYGVDTSTLTSEWGDPVEASTEDAARVLTRGAELLSAVPEAGGVRITVTEAEATAALSIGLLLSDLTQAAGRIPQEEVRSATDLQALRERIWEESEIVRREVASRAGWAERVLLAVDPRIRTGDVEVRFEGSGEVVVAGYVEAWGVKLPGLFAFAPSAGADELELDFVSGRLGRAPLPELLFDWAGRSVARGVLAARGIARIEEISIEDGRATFVAATAR